MLRWTCLGFRHGFSCMDHVTMHDVMISFHDVVCCILHISCDMIAPAFPRSFFPALSHLYHTEGLSGFYRGFIPGLFGTVHGAIQFMSYEQVSSMDVKIEYSPETNHIICETLRTPIFVILIPHRQHMKYLSYHVT